LEKCKVTLEIMNEAILHIGLSFDENFLNQFYALTSSIFFNNKKEHITIHAITSGISEEEKEKIRKLATRNNACILFYSVPSGFGSDFILNGNWTAATYYRLLLPELLPIEVNNYLYLDTDTLVVGSLYPIFQTDLSTNYVAAVRDRLVPTREDLGITEPFTYFNAGVLLINRKMWIDENITEKALKFLTAYPEKIYYADQDALNYLFKGCWSPLCISYNLMFADIPEGLSKKEYKFFLRDKVIIHFTQHRPWKMLCQNPYRQLYHKYLKASQFKGFTKYIDFDYKKIPAFLKIKLIEAYWNFPFIKSLWQRLKKQF
jgi:lipopolysaccharide biosynthesis glycosyltransferase